MPTVPNPPETDEVVPIKTAAARLGLPYKMILRLCKEGVIPALNLNANSGGKRPRFVVIMGMILQFMREESEKQAAMRRAPVRAINLHRLVQPR